MRIPVRQFCVGDEVLVISQDIVAYGMVLDTDRAPRTKSDSYIPAIQVSTFIGGQEDDTWLFSSKNLFLIQPDDGKDKDGNDIKVLRFDIIENRPAKADILSTMLAAEGWKIRRVDSADEDNEKYRSEIEATCSPSDYEDIVRRRKKIYGIEKAADERKEDDGQVTLDEVIKKAEAREMDAATA